MTRANDRMRSRRMLLVAGTAMTIILASPAAAQAAGESVAEQIEGLRRELSAQRSLIEQQRGLIEEQRQEIDALNASLRMDRALSQVRGAGLGQVEAGSAAENLPDAPVGEAPPEREVEARARVEAVPEGQGVLTPRGRFVIDPQLEFVQSSTNRLVFRGFELIPGIQVGLIEASDADRDTLVATAALRYGLTDRLEAEVRLPYLYRRDRIEVAQQRDEGIVRVIDLEDDHIGDLEFGLRYQLNRPRPLRPIWVASLRVKSNTGQGPFDIDYDEFGVATGLATGSGFWAIQPGISFLLPSDPVVIYGGASYLWHLPDDVDRLVGGALVGRVDPGDAINANIGFGFALNPRFSFSLGYRHSYIFPTETEIGTTLQRSNRLQSGAFTFGMSYRITERQTMNLGFAFGATADAPDVQIALRMPFGLQAPWSGSRQSTPVPEPVSAPLPVSPTAPAPAAAMPPPPPAPPASAASLPLESFMLVFAPESSELAADAAAALDRAAQHLSAGGPVRIVIAGRFEPARTRAHDVDLAAGRAGRVRRALVTRGIPETAIAIGGFAATASSGAGPEGPSATILYGAGSGN